jgi:hypothetical protein
MIRQYISQHEHTHLVSVAHVGVTIGVRDGSG